MLDIRFIREQPDRVKQAAEQKGVAVDIDQLLDLDSQRRELQGTIDALQQQRNDLAKRNQGGQPTAADITTGKRLKTEFAAAEAAFNDITAAWRTLLEQVPNLPSDDTPVGPDESANQVLRQVGEKPSFDFTPREHWQLGEALDLIDNERAAAVTGSRFTFLKGALAHLQFALIQYALAVLTNREQLAAIIANNNLTVPDTPFIPVIPPVFIKPAVMQAMARLEPKEERYYIASDDLYLVGSAEHTLGAMHQTETFPEAALPLRYVGYSTAFRREAGSYGKDVRGILRMHQFDKVEMESFTTPEHAIAEQNFMVAIQEHLMQSLQLPYQVVICSTGDMGGPDARHLDLETWLPGQARYRETHSADYMTDYQARRLKIKVKRTGGEREFVHMNDATVFAIGRMLIAIMENYQQADGSIAVPAALHPYLPFTHIKPA